MVTYVKQQQHPRPKGPRQFHGCHIVPLSTLQQSPSCSDYQCPGFSAEMGVRTGEETAPVHWLKGGWEGPSKF